MLKPALSLVWIEFYIFSIAYCPKGRLSELLGRNQLVLVAAAFEIAPDEMGKSRAQAGGALPNVILELR